MTEQGLLMVTNMEGSEITVPLKNGGKQRKVNFDFYRNLSFICRPTGGIACSAKNLSHFSMEWQEVNGMTAEK